MERNLFQTILALDCNQIHPQQVVFVQLGLHEVPEQQVSDSVVFLAALLNMPYLFIQLANQFDSFTVEYMANWYPFYLILKSLDESIGFFFELKTEDIPVIDEEAEFWAYFSVVFE